MKKQIGLMTLSLMLVTPALAGGAGAPVKAAPTTCKSIAQIVMGDAQLSTLATAVEAAGLTSTLSGKGSYTVFAPTNAAFAKVPSDQLAGLLNNSQALKGLLLYHVVGEKATSQQIRSVQGGTTMQGAAIAVHISGKKLMINNATVIKADIMACNGVVHVIDTVLMPPATKAASAPAPATGAAPASAPAPAPAAPAAPALMIPALPLSGAATTTQQTTTTTDAAAATPMTDTSAPASTTDTSAAAVTSTTTTTTDTTATTTTDASATATTTTDMASSTVYDVIANDDRFGTLRDLISDADLGESLTSGEYTIFAPTDEAFAAIPEDILAAIQSDPAALKTVLQYHVVNHKVSQKELENASQVKTLQGAMLDLGAGKLGTAINVSNGVVYPIDVVLIPTDFKVPDVAAVAADTSTTPPNITTFLISDARFSTLRGLLSKAGLADTLTTGDYTIFAPTNDAFAKLDPTKLADISKDNDKLKALLQAHVLTGHPDAAGLMAAPLKTLGGTDLTITKDGNNLKIGASTSDGMVTTTGNGNVYVIDTVILPDSLK